MPLFRVLADALTPGGGATRSASALNVSEALALALRLRDEGRQNIRFVDADTGDELNLIDFMAKYANG